MKTVYHLGYNARGSEQRLKTVMDKPRVLLIDTRFRPDSYKPGWKWQALQARYGDRYRKAGHCLGNRNYHGGPIDIVDLDTGIQGSLQYLQEGYDLLYLCRCPGATCHRYIVLNELQRRVPGITIVPPEAIPLQASMKCLSIRQPYAHWLTHPQVFLAAGLLPKTIENRTWSTKYRGPVLIHASRQVDTSALRFWFARYPALRQVVPASTDAYPKGAIVGMADFVDVVKESNDPWFVGTYGFVFAHARPLEAIPYPGQLSLFDVPLSILTREVKR